MAARFEQKNSLQSNLSNYKTEWHQAAQRDYPYLQRGCSHVTCVRVHGRFTKQRKTRTLRYMELVSYFLFLQEQIKDIIIITAPRPLVHAHAAGEGSTDTAEDASQGWRSRPVQTRSCPKRHYCRWTSCSTVPHETTNEERWRRRQRKRADPQLQVWRNGPRSRSTTTPDDLDHCNMTQLHCKHDCPSAFSITI